MKTALNFLKNFLARAPLWLCLVFGYLVGFVMYANKKRRFTAFKNIKSAFPQKSNRELYAIVKKSFINIGISITEIFIAPRIFKYVDATTFDSLPEGGAVVAAVHEGSWELYNAQMAQKKKYIIFAKSQKNIELDSLLNDLRASWGVKVCFSLKEVVKYMNEGAYLGMAVDHGAEDNAVFVRFFSHLVPAPGGIVYLARKFNKKIYPCFGRRVKGFRHTAQILPPIDPAGKSDQEVLQELNSIYEAELKKYPSEYVWHYKRFKHKRDLDVLVLDDGKAGHLKQSLAFLKFLQDEDYEVRPKIVSVNFRSKNFRTLTDVCTFFSHKGCLGCGACMRLFLDTKTFKELKSSYADIVVSAGSFLASANRLYAYTVGAKSVSILRPNIPLNRFDLAILPEHDRVGTESTVQIKGALCYPSDADDKAQKCRHFFNLGDTKKAAFFLGGVLSDKKEFEQNVKDFSLALKKFSMEKGYKLLISTSRRTPAHIDAYIKQEFSSFAGTEALVFPNQENHDFIFDGFCGLSDIVFVSGDSISMISEAASLKKTCVAVAFEKNEDKHKVFLEMIANEINVLMPPYDISGLNFKISTIFENNRKTIQAAIKRIL
jgi:KDO2-lipid IV(A) lauroyltransferase